MISRLTTFLFLSVATLSTTAHELSSSFVTQTVHLPIATIIVTVLPSITTQTTLTTTPARSPAESSKAAEHLKKVELGSDKIMIIVVTVILILLTAIGLGLGWYRGFYLPKKKKREEEGFKKGLKPLRLQPGPVPATPLVVSLQPV